MTNEKMEQRLAAALEKTAPDDVNGVLSRCEERKGTVIPVSYTHLQPDLPQLQTARPPEGTQADRHQHRGEELRDGGGNGHAGHIQRDNHH